MSNASNSDFSQEETQRLAPFVSNMDKPVFVLKNLPQEVAGALFSRYSRSPNSVRRILLNEFLAEEESGLSQLTDRTIFDDAEVRTDKARDFYERVLAGYGDDSIGELGGVHIAVEDVSNIASKVLEDARIGISPLEKSTRYVRFDEQVNGRYRYYLDPEVMQSPHAQTYEDALKNLFTTYAQMIEPMTEWVKAKWPKKPDEVEKPYNAAAKAKALDSIRGLLPAATLTNVGMYGNGRAFEYLLTKMYAHPLAEMRQLAASMHEELSKVIPTLVKRANDEKYGQATQAFFKEQAKVVADFVAENLADESPQTGERVTLVDYDENAEARVLAGVLYEYSELSSQQLREVVHKLPAAKKQQLIRAIAEQRNNRRHRPGRGFEYTNYEFDFLVNYGAYRDLQRHRVLSQNRQLLNVIHGYDVPEQVVEAGFETQFRVAMDQAALAYKQIAGDFPQQAQYVVPFGYKLRYRMQLNLREAYHLIELRSTPQGHPDYRLAAQEMFYRIKEVHPLLAEAMKFVDLSGSDDMERRAAEAKKAKKLAALAKKK